MGFLWKIVEDSIVQMTQTCRGLNRVEDSIVRKIQSFRRPNLVEDPIV